MMRRLGRSTHRQPRLIVDEAPRGSTPRPARASPESALPATRFASGGGRSEKPTCVNLSVGGERACAVVLAAGAARGIAARRPGLPSGLSRGGARGAIGSPRVRRVARRKVRKEGRTAEAWVRRAPRATPWSLAPRFGAADVSSRRLKRLRAAPASQPGRARPPPKPGDVPFRVRSDRRRTLDTALRGAGLTPHPAPTSRTPPEAPLVGGMHGV